MIVAAVAGLAICAAGGICAAALAAATNSTAKRAAWEETMLSVRW